jgi:hypothetical protein
MTFREVSSVAVNECRTAGKDGRVVGDFKRHTQRAASSKRIESFDG